MCKKGHEVTCVVQGVDEYDKEHPIVPHENLEIIYCPYRTFTTPLEFQKSDVMRKLIPKKFDIVFGSHVQVSPTTKMVAETFGLPWGIMLLDIPTHLMKVQRGRMMDWVYYFDVMKFANVILFNTHIARDEYYKYTHQWFDDPCVITYGINMNEEYFKSGLDTKGDYVLSVCRMNEQKNCNLIPRALGLITGIKKYIAVGWDDGDLELTKRLCEVNGIEFEHYENLSEENKFKLIRDCAMLIYPQKTEYIGGLSPWEGLYAGKPVLVPKLKVLHDLYKSHAIYFENDNSVSLAREISFTNDIRPEITRPLREQGADFAKIESSFETMASRMLHIFESIINVQK
jgi:glycosyltransferase involved in cell wall biosynthesis